MRDDDDVGVQLAHCLLFLAAADLQISGNGDLAEADRWEGRCPGWARFLRRRGLRKRARAEVLAPGGYDPE